MEEWEKEEEHNKKHFSKSNAAEHKDQNFKTPIEFWMYFTYVYIYSLK